MMSQSSYTRDRENLHEAVLKSLPKNEIYILEVEQFWCNNL